MAIPPLSTRDGGGFSFRPTSRFCRINFLLEQAYARSEANTKSIHDALAHLNRYLEKIEAFDERDTNMVCVAAMNCMSYVHAVNPSESTNLLHINSSNGLLPNLSDRVEPEPEDEVVSSQPVKKRKRVTLKIADQMPAFLMGSTEGFYDDRQGRCGRRCVILPNSVSRTAWDVGCLFVVLIDSIIVPFQMAYMTDLEEIEDLWFLIGFSVFALDICLNFFTGFIAGPLEKDHGHVVTSHWRMIKYYLRTWFLIDLVSTVPWSLIVASSVGGGSGDVKGTRVAKVAKIAKIARFMRLARMLKLLKLQSVWEDMENSIGSAYLVELINLFKVFCFLGYICHWNACIWWMIGSPESLFNQSEEEFPELWTTVTSSSVFLDIHGEPFTQKVNWQQLDHWDAYIFCFFWTTGVMRTMPALVYPINKFERVYVLSFMFVGMSIFAVCLSKIINIWTKLGSRRAEFDENVSAVRAYLFEKNIDQQVGERVRGFFDHRFATRSIFAKEQKMFAHLSDGLLAELNGALYVKQIKTLWVLQGLSSSECVSVARIARTSDTAPGDELTSESWFASYTGILMSGKLSDCDPVTQRTTKAPGQFANRPRRTATGNIFAFNVSIMLFREPSLCDQNIWSEICCSLILIDFPDFVALRRELPKLNKYLQDQLETPTGKAIRIHREMRFSKMYSMGGSSLSTDDMKGDALTKRKEIATLTEPESFDDGGAVAAT
eukprot:GEMP01016507.1.p1 GENE.GEMP01016507.1~~GEMP01016507.1.p1  ORF type:complete len:718 (+),score=105.64 GEMP01016507.1:304-2457(+)